MCGPTWRVVCRQGPSPGAAWCTDCEWLAQASPGQALRALGTGGLVQPAHHDDDLLASVPTGKCMTGD